MAKRQRVPVRAAISATTADAAAARPIRCSATAARFPARFWTASTSRSRCPQPPEDLSQTSSSDSSTAIRERVQQARARMIARQGKENGRLTTREIDKYCVLDEKGATLLKQAISRLGLSARGYHRILKVARTIADLAGAERISDAQVAEAIQYRRFDRA